MLRPNKSERIKFNVDYSRDTDFAAYARFLQSKWRETKGYPQLKDRLGNFLDTDFAWKYKVNFLTENIRHLVTREIENAKNSGALISEPRIWNNLLSSQPLCFNLFGELSYDLNLATRYFQHLFPNKIDVVTEILFEYSPGRGEAKYLRDHSAFDFFVKYTKNNQRGFIGIEVKYAESLREESKEKSERNFKPEYQNITDSCGIFKPESVPYLMKPPLSQIWRDHLLCLATKQDFDEGFFVFLFPSQNDHCKAGIDDYRKFLVFDDEMQNSFYARHLEEFLDALSAVSNADWIIELKQRYLGVSEYNFNLKQI